jgi:hypothetical protein
MYQNKAPNNEKKQKKRYKKQKNYEINVAKTKNPAFSWVHCF